MFGVRGGRARARCASAPGTRRRRGPIPSAMKRDPRVHPHRSRAGVLRRPFFLTSICNRSLRCLQSLDARSHASPFVASR